jgi:hypothetical protein
MSAYRTYTHASGKLQEQPWENGETAQESSLIVLQTSYERRSGRVLIALLKVGFPQQADWKDICFIVADANDTFVYTMLRKDGLPKEYDREQTSPHSAASTDLPFDQKSTKKLTRKR